MSLLHPVDGVAGSSREPFLDDLLAEHVREVRGCLLLTGNWADRGR